MITLEQARPWYSNADPVHNFDHIQRVYNLATKIALAEGADLEIVQAAALLHDANGSDGHDEVARTSHHLDSAEFAGKYLSAQGWSPEHIEAVKHCIISHRFRDTRVTPQTIEAKVLFDADKLDSIGAIGAARAIAYAAGANAPFYFPPSKSFIETGERIDDEPHSAYHEHIYKLSKIIDRMHTKTGKELAAKREEFLGQFFETLIAEWEGYQ